MKKFFSKLDRLAAWLLFVIIIIFAVSGFGMTKGLFDPSLAEKMHLGRLGIMGMICFVIHTGYAIHLALKRHRLWNKFSLILLLIFYLALIAGFIYVDFFYEKRLSSISQSVNADFQIIEPLIIEDLPSFSRQELKLYDGLNGRPAYAAVDGLVYDFSSLYLQGRHFSHPAGLDLTAEFDSRHGREALAGYSVVGVLTD